MNDSLSSYSFSGPSSSPLHHWSNSLIYCSEIYIIKTTNLCTQMYPKGYQRRYVQYLFSEEKPSLSFIQLSSIKIFYYSVWPINAELMCHLNSPLAPVWNFTSALSNDNFLLIGHPDAVRVQLFQNSPAIGLLFWMSDSCYSILKPWYWLLVHVCNESKIVFDINGNKTLLDSWTVWDRPEQ